MLAQLVTGGSTFIGSGARHYHGAKLSTGAYTLTVHNANGTTAAVAGNLIDRMVHVASRETLCQMLNTSGVADNGVFCPDGLVTVLTAAATAVIYYD